MLTLTRRSRPAPLTQPVVRSRSCSETIRHVSIEATSLDVRTAPKLRHAVREWCDARLTAVDFDAVTVVDSAGLSVLMQSVRRVRRAGGELALLSVRPDVITLLELVGVHQTVDIYNSLDELQQAVTRPATTAGDPS